MVAQNQTARSSWLADAPHTAPLNSFRFSDLVILDLANNHQGDVSHAKRIIDSCGLFQDALQFRVAIKFQFRDLDSFILSSERDANPPNNYVKRFLETELSLSDFDTLQTYARRQGLLVGCTPFDEASVANVKKLEFDFLKVASASASDWPLMEVVADTAMPIIASTGGLDQVGVDRVVSFLTNHGTNFALMHCVSIYPSMDEELQLRTIQKFVNRYPGVTVGWSTHERPDNDSAVVMAYAYGARIFERHVGEEGEGISLNAYSSSPRVLSRWGAALELAIKMEGKSDSRKVSDKELMEVDALRRGVFMARKVGAGEILSDSDVYFAFPASAEQLSPGEFRSGTKVLADLLPDAPLLKSEIEPSEQADGELHPQLVASLHKIKGMLSEFGIPTPASFETEMSHHYGPENFERFGTTLITTLDREYGKKILIQLPGQLNPSHSHSLKEESFYVLAGTLNLVVDSKEVRLQPGDIWTILPGQWHEFYSESGCIFEEISTRIVSGDSEYRDSTINARGEGRKTRITLWGKRALTPIRNE